MFTLNRHEISCHVVYDCSEFELCAISKPRGRPQLSESLKNDLQPEIETLQSELTFDNSNTLVHMISFASDEIIYKTTKYLEVFL